MSVNTIRDARRALAEADPHSMPAAVGASRQQSFAAKMTVRSEKVGGAERAVFDGYATVFERSYVMYDMWGEYNEVVATGAADKTLAAQPDVAFLINHRGLTLARTLSGSLTLSADATGMHDEASTNPERSDVRDLRAAVSDGDVTEQSFAFMITNGQWDPNYTTFRITEYDIDRGDVSAVNFGANPYTSVAARSSEILAVLEHLPLGARRAAMDRLQRSMDAGALVGDPDPVVPIVPVIGGTRSISQLAALLELTR